MLTQTVCDSLVCPIHRVDDIESTLSFDTQTKTFRPTPAKPLTALTTCAVSLKSARPAKLAASGGGGGAVPPATPQ